MQPSLVPVISCRINFPKSVPARTMHERLLRLAEELPELSVRWQEETGELLVQTMGEVQLEILQSLIHERFGVEVTFGEGAIVYRETVGETTYGVGHFEPLRHYAEVHLRIDPGERGSGVRVQSLCSEDMLAKNWQRLILTHLQERVHTGVLLGAPLTDVVISLIAGRAHPKHTEGGDFRQATYRAVRNALRRGNCRILEPVYEYRLELPTEAVGRAMTDLQQKRLNLLHNILSNKGVEYSKINTVFTSREPNSFILRTISLDNNAGGSAQKTNNGSGTQYIQW